jgi:hypothetical protein
VLPPAIPTLIELTFGEHEATLSRIKVRSVAHLCSWKGSIFQPARDLLPSWVPSPPSGNSSFPEGT